MKPYSTKKTPRVYTPIESFSHLVSLIESRGDRVQFKYIKDKKFVDLSCADFARMVKSVAAGLAAAGLAASRVAVIGESSPEWLAVYIGVVAGGGVIVPLDKELAVGEIEGFLESVNAEAIVYSASFNEKFAPLKENHPTLKKFIPLSGEADEKTLPFADLLAMGAAELGKGLFINT